MNPGYLSTLPESRNPYEQAGTKITIVTLTVPAQARKNTRPHNLLPAGATPLTKH